MPPSVADLRERAVGLTSASRCGARMNAFVQLREMLSSNRELARRFAQLETRLDKKLTEHDRAICAILSAIRELRHPKASAPNRRPIGFTADLEEKS